MRRLIGLLIVAVLGVVFFGTRAGSAKTGVEWGADPAPEPGVKTEACPIGMIRITGSYCPEVSEVCLRWLDKDQSPKANSGIGPLRCGEFQYPTKCLSKERKCLDFCMSEYEYPGEGTYPLVGMDYHQAKAIAAKDGNRLCTVEEFNFACEGESVHPYGYGLGYTRDDGSNCVIDRPWIDYSKFPKSSWNDVNGGLYQAIKSEASNKCRTWAGIANLNGNVDEILDSEKSDGVVLSGGYWGLIRARCRPKTEHIHDKGFAFYQVGMRECSDVRYQ